MSAKDSIEDKIFGLDLGADDYLVKPFDIKEFLARVRVQIRQRYNKSSNILTIDNLVLNTSKKVVTRDGIEINLTAKEYEILVYLMQNENHIISREQILENVWHFESELYSNIIDVMIKNIRKKISFNKTYKQLIFTKRGLGYVIQNK